MPVFTVTFSWPLMLYSSFAIVLHGCSGLSVRKIGGGSMTLVGTGELEGDVDLDDDNR